MAYRMASKLNVGSLALAVGALWASYMFFIGISSAYGWGNAFLDVMKSIYIGFSPGLIGAITGAAWGFLDGAIAGAVVAYVYNWREAGKTARKRR